MSGAPGYQDDLLAKAHVPQGQLDGTTKEAALESTSGRASSDDEYPDKPTEEELHTLRRVAGKINWSIYTIAFVELCERFGYYGSYVLYANFVRNPLPTGSLTGALGPNYKGDELPGALGMGMKTGQAISLINQFWAYLVPLFG